jgi:hypothetical protein
VGIASSGVDGSAVRIEARGDIIMALPHGISITDIRPLSVQIPSRATDMAGAAGSFCDHQKVTAYARAEPNGYGFVPFSVETYGRLGQLAMKLLHQLGNEAAGASGVSRASFVSGGLRELSVDLVRGNFWLYRATVGMLARVSGSSFRPCLSQPTDDFVVE